MSVVAKRIVSLTPSNTEILFELGVGSRLVGVTSYCDYPPAAKTIAKVGDSNISPEKVLALKPDLVVAHRFLNNRVIPTLKRLKLRVLEGDPSSYQTVLEFTDQIAKAVGAQARSKSLRARAERTLKQVQSALKGSRSRPETLFLLNLEPVWACGSGNLPHDLIRLAGGKNTTESLGKGFRAASMELIYARNPEVIVATLDSLEPLMKSDRWQRVKAVQNGRVYRLESNDFFRETPTRAERALRSLVTAIHPDLRLGR